MKYRNAGAKRKAVNKFRIASAIENAEELKSTPSALEQKMILFLDSHQIPYEFQKIFLIRDSGGYIKRYYIADFYIYTKNIIIETDGKFHDNQVAFDEFRTREIMKHCLVDKVIRWRWDDFRSINKMRSLLVLLK